jgi:hypothetical protein
MSEMSKLNKGRRSEVHFSVFFQVVYEQLLVRAGLSNCLFRTLKTSALM